MLTPKDIKLFNVVTFGCHIARSNRGRTLLQTFLTKLFLNDSHACHRSLTLICVTVVCLASFFLNVRSKAEAEGVQTWWQWGPRVFEQKLMLAFNQSFISLSQSLPCVPAHCGSEWAESSQNNLLVDFKPETQFI